LLPLWEDDSVAQQKEIDFSEDNSEILLVLLNITHLRFGKIPTGRMNCEQLFNLAVLCDGYDCVELVKPWLAAWMLNEAGISHYVWSSNSMPWEKAFYLVI